MSAELIIPKTPPFSSTTGTAESERRFSNSSTFSPVSSVETVHTVFAMM
jgi:hypothetical protein